MQMENKQVKRKNNKKDTTKNLRAMFISHMLKA